MSKTPRTDFLYRYLFNNADVRGEWVQLDHTFQAMIEGHQYPVQVAELLGELAAATSLLTATLKFKGEITVQLQGDGPVKLAVINGSEQQVMRGVARWSEPAAQAQSLQEMMGKGVLVITISPEQGERYQGMVGLETNSVAGCIETYFNSSEQLPTLLLLAADASTGHAAGLLLQVLPAVSNKAKQQLNWEHLETLTRSMTKEEMLSLPGDQILHRLYHQDDYTLYSPQPVTFRCGCSKESSANALTSIGRDEAEALLKERGTIDIDCQYCAKRYSFSVADLDDVFSGKEQQH